MWNFKDNLEGATQDFLSDVRSAVADSQLALNSTEDIPFGNTTKAYIDSLEAALHNAEVKLNDFVPALKSLKRFKNADKDIINELAGLIATLTGQANALENAISDARNKAAQDARTKAANDRARRNKISSAIAVVVLAVIAFMLISK